MNQTFSRRAWLRFVAGSVLLGLASATACAPGGTGGQAGPTLAAPSKPAGGAPTAGLTLANSELVVGGNRLAVVVLEDGAPVPDASLRLELFQVQGQTATKRSDTEAVYRAVEGTGRGVYAALVSFDQAGTWGVQATATRANRAPLIVRSNFNVVSSSSAPRPGERGIASRNPTAREVSNLAEICSAQPACPMHDLSIADALSLGSPGLIAFATPGYCTSQTCAPVLGEVVKVRSRRQAQAAFVHLEIYKDPRNLVVADAVGEWGLQSEPWVYLFDRGGVIVERIEGLTTADELDAALSPLL